MSENIVQILKLADILGIYFACPIIAIVIEIAVRKKKGAEIKKLDIIIKWLVFFVMGIGALVAGIMQAFVPDFTATMLQIPDDSFIVIRELGFAAIGVGVVGVLSFKYENWRIPVSLARGIFILFCTLFHLTRMDIINWAELLAIIADLWIVLVALFVIINSKFHKFIETAK